MLRILALAACVAAVSADFIQLQEVCRTVDDELGLCVTSPFCCTALGGKIGTEAKASGVSRGAMPGYLARAIGEDGNKGCSYNGQCCIFPDINDFSCDSCGLKGDGDRTKERPNFSTTTTTPNPSVVVEKDIVERIVNGQDAGEYEWCWQVALMNSTGLFGGGALISRNWVVTAAHKVAGRFLDEFVVVLGEYDFAHAKTGRRVYYSTALNVILHEGFNPQTFDNNIALVRIPDAPCEEDNVCAVCLNDEPITFEATTTTTTGTSTTTLFTTTERTTTTTYAYGDANAQRVAVSFSLTASLAQINNKQNRRVGGGPAVFVGGSGGGFNPYTELVVYMTGWGSTGMTQLAPRLQEANVAIIRTDDCKESFVEIGVADPVMPDNTFCVSEPTWTRGSCYGDGGGPVVVQNRLDHSWELWGIISLGTNMCMLNAQQGPSIVTDVGYFYEWIVETLHEDLPSPDLEGKVYKVPECGSDVSNDGTEPCPDRPDYENFSRRSGIAKKYTGPLTSQFLATVHF